MLIESALQSLLQLFPAEQINIDPASHEVYRVDAGLDIGEPDGVVFPRSYHDVQRLVQWAQQYKVPLIARGAGTGLSGGAVADQGGLIVDFAQMHKILQFDVEGRTAQVEPALINIRLDELAQEHDLYFPPDPSSQRISTLGGNVAENSGGPHCFKYGVTTNYVGGMQVVLADGSVLQLGGGAFDYPEYDFWGLITGSEGLLAFITAMTLRLKRRPPAVQTLLAIFDSIALAGNAVSAVIATGLVPATMEMMDQTLIRLVETYTPAGLPVDAKSLLIIEVDGYAEGLSVQIEEIVRVLKRQQAQQIRVAHSAEERDQIWLSRKNAAASITLIAETHCTFDVTVPRSRLAEALEQVNAICKRYDLQVGHVFHAGDGNLHPQIMVPDSRDTDLLVRIHQAAGEMIRCSVAMGGTLTGEHGVGIEKRAFMSLMHTKAELRTMWDIKEVFDPAQLLNPGKVFPQATADDPEALDYRRPVSELVPATNIEVTISPEGIIAPATAEEVAQTLAALNRQHQQVRITGRVDSQLAHSQALAPVDQKEKMVTFSLEKLRGIKAYAADDLSLTVEAGTPVKDILNFLEQEQKWLPLVSLWPGATIGGLVASNINAPFRMLYGGLRDLVLCATVALPDGRLVRTGRPLVKNVAGFDLTKLFIGSYGTLGVMTDVSLKIRSRPRAWKTLLIPLTDAAQGLQIARKLAAVSLNASALLLCHNCPIDGLSLSSDVLVYTAEGLIEEVQAEIAQVRAILQPLIDQPLKETEMLTGTGIWSDLIGSALTTKILARSGVPVHNLNTYMDQVRPILESEQWIVDVASGMLYTWRAASFISQDEKSSINRWLSALRSPALATGGYTILMNKALTKNAPFDRWGYQPDSQPLMQRLKRQWDPHAILNSGDFLV